MISDVQDDPEFSPGVGKKGPPPRPEPVDWWLYAAIVAALVASYAGSAFVSNLFRSAY